MVIGAVNTVTHATAQEPEFPCSHETGARCCGAADATTVVFEYVQDRAESETETETPLDKIAVLSQRIEQLEQQMATLSTYTNHLEEALRQMQIGFRRHRSEVVPPEQLRMALSEVAAEDPDLYQAPVTYCNTPSQPGSECDDEAGNADSDDTAPCQQQGDCCMPPKPKKRDRHGRRKVGVLPRIIVTILPAEVIVGGLAGYEQIGEEDSSLLGYRRGGPFELVLRRPKFVPRRSGAAEQDPGEQGSDGGSATPGQPAEQPAAGSTPQAESAPAGSIEVFEHDVLTVPADPGFRNNPFVDGAIVRFFPETDLAARTCAVLIAPPPPRPIDKAMADPSLLAHMFVDKHDRHMPYYRQEAEFERFGWPVPRSNMTRWQHECGNLVGPLVDAMWEQALSRSWFAMDATGTAIRGSPQYERGHIFVLIAEAESVLFRFSPTYDAKTVNELFGGHAATILADASANHNVLFKDGSNREASCWAHARRRFVTAFRAGEATEPAQVLQTIQGLFRIEREIAGLTPAERVEVRQSRSAALVDDLLAKAAVRRHELPADSLTRKGFVYLDNQRESLREFLVNGEIPIHNNACESELRRPVKGRVNWLCHGSEEHARSAANILSLVASAELHGLDPELYLQEILTVLPEYPARRVMDLAPANWIETRRRLIEAGQLKYIDLARITGSRLAFRCP